MTREEAIKHGKAQLEIYDWKDGFGKPVGLVYTEFIEIAIRALENWESQYRKGFEDGLRHGDYSTKSEFGKSMIHLER